MIAAPRQIANFRVKRTAHRHGHLLKAAAHTEHRLPKLQPASVLKKGTTLLIPRTPSLDEVRREAAALHAAWHVVPEDMTFKRAAAAAHVDTALSVVARLLAPRMSAAQGARLGVRAALHSPVEPPGWPHKPCMSLRARK